MKKEWTPTELLGAHDCGFRHGSYSRLYKIAAEACFGNLWAEFGVGVGRSAARLLSLLSERGELLLFDSWLGIPTDWDLGDVPEYTVNFYKKGSFRFSKPKIKDKRVTFIDGWFSDTLPRGFKNQIALAHFDCDVYESTRDALFGCGEHIGKGTVLIFDELHGYGNYKNHEYRALNEWREKTGFDVKWLARESFAAAGVVS